MSVELGVYGDLALLSLPWYCRNNKTFQGTVSENDIDKAYLQRNHHTKRLSHVCVTT